MTAARRAAAGSSSAASTAVTAYRSVRAAVRRRGGRARDAPRLRLRRARRRARVRPPARRHAVRGDDDAARRRPEPLAGQPQRVLGVHAVADRRRSALRRSRRTTGRTATPSKTPSRAPSRPARPCCTCPRTASRRVARRGPQLRRRLPLRPGDARRSAVRRGVARRARAPRRRSSCCGATIPTAASRTRS